MTKPKKKAKVKTVRFIAPKISGVYMVRLKVNGRAYIGSSLDIRSRMNKHRSYLSNGAHYSLGLQEAWNEHGAKAFEFVIVEECPAEIRLEREQFYLDNTPNKFNLAPLAKSCLGVKYSEATIAKRLARPIAHGTVRGYLAERVRGLKSCDLCRKAVADYAMQRARLKGDAAVWGSKEHWEKRAATIRAMKNRPVNEE